MRTDRGKAAESKGGVDLLSFLSTTPGRGEEASHTQKAEEAQLINADREADVRHFLRSKGGRATKTELYNWAKRKGITPAALYSVISRMVSEGKVAKRFDESSQELVYELLK